MTVYLGLLKIAGLIIYVNRIIFVALICIKFKIKLLFIIVIIPNDTKWNEFVSTKCNANNELPI